MDTYQGPNEGFRGEVTKAAIKALQHAGDYCPSCGKDVNELDRQEHAESCTELRSDVAEKL